MFDPASLTAFLHAHSVLPLPAGLVLSPRPRVVRARETLLRAGDTPGHVFIVHSGLLESHVDTPVRHRVDWHGRGDWIGVIGALTNAPQAATVTAWRDSVVLEIDIEPLRLAAAQDQAALARLTDYLLAAGRGRSNPRPEPHVLGMVPMSHSGAIPDLLRAAADPAGFVLIDNQDWDEDSPEAIARRESRMAGARCCVWLGEDGRSAWNRAVLRNVDRLALVVPTDIESVTLHLSWLQTLLSDARRVDVLRIALPGEFGGGAGRVERDDWFGVPVYVMRANLGDVRDYLEVFSHEHADPGRLAKFELFAGLEPQALAHVQEHIEWRTVAGGSRLIRQGDSADGMYVLDMGRLEISVDDGDGRRKRLGTLAPGSTVGELAVADGRRTADVDALRDSHVGFLPRSAYRQLIHTLPEIGHNLARTLAGRLASGTDRDLRPPPSVLMVLMLDRGRRMDDFITRLVTTFQTTLGSTIRTISAASAERELGEGMSRAELGQPGYGHLISWLQAIESAHDVTLMLCSPDEEHWTLFSAHQADRVIVVAEAGGDPTPPPLEARVAELARERGQMLELVLLQDPALTEARGTLSWLTPRPQTYVHHVRDGSASDIASATRRIMGCAIGIAFSGGVGFAPAHLGVVRAMNELGLPIDIIGGTSSGSGIGAAVALGMSHAEAFSLAVWVVEELAFGWRELHPPITALTSGERFDRIVRTGCGESLIEDQFIPCAISAVDIANERVVWFDRGPMWQAIRASGSMPIIMPPVSIDGQVLVDGSLAAHNPIEPLLPRCERGLLIVSELVGPGRSHLSTMPSYGTRLSGWTLLADRVLPWRKPTPVPNIADIITRSMTLSNSLPGEQMEWLTRHPAICHVQSVTAAANAFKVGRELAERLEARAYNSSRARLAEWCESPPFRLRT